MHDGKPAVVLDQTAFYPTSGGQPYDTGRLGDATVVDVIDAGDDVVHVLDSMLSEGAAVSGVIDAHRRLDHMQQHTGQHVLSAAFDRLFDNRTTSFHMGGDVSTIDLAAPVSDADVSAAIAESNRIVWENRPVSVRFVSETEAARLPLRKDPARTGALRLVEVESFDLSACGGTHVSRTGTIGVIAALGHEKARGGARLTFVCGQRALRVLETYRDAISGSVRVLSVLPHELPAAVERVQGEAKEIRRQIAHLQEKLAQAEAERLVQSADVMSGVKVIAVALDGWDAAGIKVIAAAAARQDSVVAVIATRTSPVAVAIGRSATVTIDAGRILKALTERFGGRGGGKPDFAQGGGLSGSPADILDAARQAITAALSG